MTNPGVWVVDPETKEEIFLLYSELEEGIKAQLLKPIGGFIFPADAFLSIKLPSVPFYLKDWLPKRGKTLLYAPPKSGKSYSCLQLARCIGIGEPFLGIPTTKGKVLYIQFELGEEVLQKRLIDSKQEYENVFVGTTFSMKLDSPLGQKTLIRAMKAVEPQVLILDPWYKAILGDENESSDSIKIIDFLDSIIESFNCSIFIIHHAGKDISKRGRGSSVLEDWVDSYIQMQKISKDGEPLRIKIKPIFLRHAANPPDAVEAVLNEHFEFDLVAKTPKVKEQVLAFIQKETGAVTPKQIFDMNIGSNTSVYSALKSLVDEGKIIKTEWGQYSLKLDTP
jgi:hypothetical protein